MEGAFRARNCCSTSSAAKVTSLPNNLEAPMKISHWPLYMALFVLSACGGVPKREGEYEAPPRYMEYAGEPIHGFSNLSPVDSWHSLDRDKLLVWTGVNDAYLLTVESS